MKRSFIVLAGLIILLTLIFGTIYVTIQQAVRANADTAQISQSEAIRARLEAGVAPADLELTKVSVAHSISPFTIVYDDKGMVVASGADVEGKTPEVPKGVLEEATPLKQNRVSWQPTKTVRIAAVVTRTGDGKYYVLGGRSLRETERLESRTLLVTVLAWVASLGTVAIGYMIMQQPDKNGSLLATGRSLLRRLSP